MIFRSSLRVMVHFLDAGQEKVEAKWQEAEVLISITALVPNAGKGMGL